MIPPRRLRILTESDLRHLTVARLLAYRKKALSLENMLLDSDYNDATDKMDDEFIWFKEDPRWQAAYDNICTELARKQAAHGEGHRR